MFVSKKTFFYWSPIPYVNKRCNHVN